MFNGEWVRDEFGQQELSHIRRAVPANINQVQFLMSHSMRAAARSLRNMEFEDTFTQAEKEALLFYQPVLEAYNRISDTILQDLRCIRYGLGHRDYPHNQAFRQARTLRMCDSVDTINDVVRDVLLAVRGRQRQSSIVAFIRGTDWTRILHTDVVNAEPGYDPFNFEDMRQVGGSTGAGGGPPTWSSERWSGCHGSHTRFRRRDALEAPQRTHVRVVGSDYSKRLRCLQRGSPLLINAMSTEIFVAHMGMDDFSDDLHENQKLVEQATKVLNDNGLMVYSNERVIAHMYRLNEVTVLINEYYKSINVFVGPTQWPALRAEMKSLCRLTRYLFFELDTWNCWIEDEGGQLKTDDELEEVIYTICVEKDCSFIRDPRARAQIKHALDFLDLQC